MRRVLITTAALVLIGLCFVLLGSLHWGMSLAQFSTTSTTTQPAQPPKNSREEEEKEITCSAHGPVVARFVKKIEPLFEKGSGIKIRCKDSKLPVLQQVLDKKVDFCCLMRHLTDVEKLRKLNETQIGWEAYALIVNKRNTCEALSQDDLLKIYTGKLTDWSDAGGPHKPVSPIVPDEGTDARDELNRYILKGATLGRNVKPSGSDYLTVETVARSPHAIGIVSLHMVEQSEDVKIVKLDKIAPTDEDVASRKYPLRRPILFITLDKPTDDVKKFFTFCLTPTAQEQMAKCYSPVKLHRPK